MARNVTRKLSTRPLLLAVMLLALGLVLSGCSATRLGYEALPTLARWQIDRHLDLDTAQAALVSQQLDELQRWHRATELPAYAAKLTALEADFRLPVTPEAVSSWRVVVSDAWKVLALRLAPGVVELAYTLRPEQFAALARRFERSSAEFGEEILAGSAQRRSERRADRVVRRAERFIGNLSDAQERDVRRWAAALPAAETDWLAERRARNQRLQALLESIAAERPAREEAQRRVRAVLVNFWVSEDVQRRSRIEAAVAASDALSARILNIATPQQVAHLRETVREYVADFRALSPAGAGSPGS